MKNTSFSILGVCSSRDIFSFQENDGQKEIQRFIQSVNPVSAVANPLLSNPGEINKEIFINKSNFYIRNITLDLQKKVFDYLSEVQSDYLIIDAGSFRKDLFFKKGSFDYLSTLIFKDTAEILRKHNNIGDYEINDIFSIPEKILNNYIRKYCNEIKKQYEENRVIIVELQEVKCHIDIISKEIDFFNEKDVDADNLKMDYGLNMLRKEFPDAHLIEFPRNVLGDTRHKWKKGRLHYLKEYYDYAFNCINIIEKKLPLNDERMLLCKEKEKVESIFEKIWLSSLKKNNFALKKYKYYEGYFKKLLLECDKYSILNKLKADIESCAFYGCNEISKLLFNWFNSVGVDVKYFVENFRGINTYMGIDIVKRSSAQFENVDLMIVCDINALAVKQKLQKTGYTGDVIDAVELLKYSENNTH